VIALKAGVKPLQNRLDVKQMKITGEAFDKRRRARLPDKQKVNDDDFGPIRLGGASANGWNQGDSEMVNSTTPSN